MLNPSGEVTLTGVAGRGPCYGFAASAADLESSAAGFPSSPRRFSNGSMYGSRPTKFLNKLSASAEPPRLSNVCRKRPPFSRFQSSMFLDPFHAVGIEDFAPDIRVISSGISSEESVREIWAAITGWDRRKIDPTFTQRRRFKSHCILGYFRWVELIPGLIEQ